MKYFIVLLFLVSCGGSSTPRLPTTKILAAEIRDGAWNSNREYTNTYILPQGEIKLECGELYEGSVLIVRNNTTLIGSGNCAKIPTIKTFTGRTYNIHISNLTIDGDLDPYGNIGIDFENCSSCSVNNVSIVNVDYGVFVYGQAYYNDFNNLHIKPRKTCYEIGGVANSNHIDKGSCLGIKGETYGVVLDSVNNTSISYTSFESHKVGIDMSGTVNTAVIIGIRLEAMDVGIDASGSRNETILGVYYSGVDDLIKD